MYVSGIIMIYDIIMEEFELCLSAPNFSVFDGGKDHRERVSSKPIASLDSFRNAQLGILTPKSRSFRASLQ